MFKDENFTPTIEHENKVYQVMIEFMKIYLTLSKNNIIHRMIRPDFLFYSNSKLKLVLFTFSCLDLKFVKTTIKHTENKAIENMQTVSDQSKINKVYTEKYDIFFIGKLFYYLLYKRDIFSNKSEEKIKSIIRNLDTHEFPKISQSSIEIIKLCFEENFSRRITPRDLLTKLFQFTVSFLENISFFNNNYEPQDFIEDNDAFNNNFYEDSYALLETENSKLDAKLLSKSLINIGKDIDEMKTDIEKLFCLINNCFELMNAYTDDEIKLSIRVLNCFINIAENFVYECFVEFPLWINNSMGDKENGIANLFHQYTLECFNEIKRFEERLSYYSNEYPNLLLRKEKNINDIVKNIKMLRHDIQNLKQSYDKETEPLIKVINEFLDVVEKDNFIKLFKYKF